MGKRNEEAKAKKAAANKKVQNLKVLEKMLSTSTLPINAQQKFRNRLKTESLNKFKTNVITAIKTKTRKLEKKGKSSRNKRINVNNFSYKLNKKKNRIKNKITRIKNKKRLIKFPV